jgi:hypothetical protein
MWKYVAQRKATNVSRNPDARRQMSETHGLTF